MTKRLTKKEKTEKLQRRFNAAAYKVGALFSHELLNEKDRKKLLYPALFAKSEEEKRKFIRQANNVFRKFDPRMFSAQTRKRLGL